MEQACNDFNSSDLLQLYQQLSKDWKFVDSWKYNGLSFGSRIKHSVSEYITNIRCPVSTGANAGQWQSLAQFLRCKHCTICQSIVHPSCIHSRTFSITLLTIHCCKIPTITGFGSSRKNPTAGGMLIYKGYLCLKTDPCRPNDDS